MSAKNYIPQDRMHVFWLQNPTMPRLVGSLDLTPRLKSANFQYSSSWLKDSFSLSPDLPLRAGEFLPEPEHLPGATLGGTKPKSLVNIEGQVCIVKFSERDEALDVGLVEHATMTLAQKAGLYPAQTRPIDLGASHGHAVAVQRFDRLQQGTPQQTGRLHAMSPRTAVRVIGGDFSYAEFALYLRRYAPAHEAQHMAATLYRRMDVQHPRGQHR